MFPLGFSGEGGIVNVRVGVEDPFEWPSAMLPSREVSGHGSIEIVQSMRCTRIMFHRGVAWNMTAGRVIRR